MSMPMTTIKVDSMIRDRLAGIARARGQTMGALLSTIVDRLEAEHEWAEIEESYTRLRRENPAAWHEYLRELSDWELGGEPDTTAAEEWPEYNR